MRAIVVLALLAFVFALPVAAHHRPGHSGGPPTPGPTPTPTSTPSATPSPTPSPTPTPTSTPTSPTPTPTPTTAPTPTATPDDGYCSASVHAQYTTTGPDGLTYATWHPQQDPSGCYFGHEHGSDPRLFGDGSYIPTFDYVNAVAGRTEAHVGFKDFLLETNGYQWLFTVHLGSAGQPRACVRFHSIELALARLSDRQQVAHLVWLGDFGRSESNLTTEPLTPANCPTQAQDAAGSTGVRQLSVNDPDDSQYEPWRVALENTALGLVASDLQWNTLSALTTCDGLNCDTVSPTTHQGKGSFRLMDWSSSFSLTGRGTFQCDVFGKGTSGPITNHVDDGLVATSQTNGDPEHAWPIDPVTMLYRVSSGNSPTSHTATNLDGRIRAPN
jgi:hypothetical protein